MSQNEIGVFISYRREDEPFVARFIFRELNDHFDSYRVFLDVESILPGTAFPSLIEQTIEASALVIAVIGAKWNPPDTTRPGENRMDASDDWVRVELEQADRLGRTVIPVLVNGASMPSADQLPRSLAWLTHVNAISVSHDSFRSHIDRLISVIESTLEATPSPSGQLPDQVHTVPATPPPSTDSQRRLAEDLAGRYPILSQAKEIARSLQLPDPHESLYRSPRGFWFALVRRAVETDEVDKLRALFEDHVK